METQRKCKMHNEEDCLRKKMLFLAHLYKVQVELL